MPLYQQGGLPTKRGGLESLPQIVKSFLDAKNQERQLKLNEMLGQAQAKYYMGEGRESSGRDYTTRTVMVNGVPRIAYIPVDPRSGLPSEVTEYEAPESPMNQFYRDIFGRVGGGGDAIDNAYGTTPQTPTRTPQIQGSGRTFRDIAEQADATRPRPSQTTERPGSKAGTPAFHGDGRRIGIYDPEGKILLNTEGLKILLNEIAGGDKDKAREIAAQNGLIIPK